MYFDVTDRWSHAHEYSKQCFRSAVSMHGRLKRKMIILIFFHFTCSRQMTATQSRFLFLCFLFFKWTNPSAFPLTPLQDCSLQLSSLYPSLCIIMFFSGRCVLRRDSAIACQSELLPPPLPPKSFSHSSSLNSLSLLLLLSCAQLFVPSLQPSD